MHTMFWHISYVSENKPHIIRSIEKQRTLLFTRTKALHIIYCYSFLSMQWSLCTALLDNFNTTSTSHSPWADTAVWLLLLFWFPAGVNLSSLAFPLRRESHLFPVKSTPLAISTSRDIADWSNECEISNQIAGLFFEQTKGIQTQNCIVSFLFFRPLFCSFVWQAVWNWKMTSFSFDFNEKKPFMLSSVQHVV